MARRTAVYGGSFNPFANHHMDIVRWLIEEAGYTTVVVVPAASHALKPDLPDFEHRLNMTQLGLAHLRHNNIPSLPFQSQAWVSKIEQDMLATQPGPIRTYELLEELRKKFNDDAEIKFAIGPDIPGEFHKWENVDKIKEEFGFVHLPIQSMRATQLREMIASGITSWHHHVPLPVRRYIERHKLYQTR